MNKKNIVVLSFLTLLLGFFSSCEEDQDIIPSVVTEDILYVSGERLRVSGRIITTQNINASDHGFYLSETESFNQPIIISLGERERPGRFIGETDGLSIEKRYYAKSFINLQGEILFGNVIEIETLSPAVFDFSPNNGPQGTVLTISGKNLTSDSQVFFGENQGQVIGISFESSMQVRVPAITNSAVVNIRVVNQGREFSFPNPFEYTTGKYTQIAQFPSPIRVFDGISLQENNVFYVGMGTDRGQAMNTKMWKYQVGDANWSEIPLPSRELWRAFSSKTYYGAGTLGPLNDISVRDFYQLKNGAFQALPELPFTKSRALAFEIGQKLFVVGGLAEESTRGFAYDVNTGQWNSISTAPFPINNAVLNFSYQNKQYFIDPETNIMHAYNTSNNFWEEVSRFPGDLGNGTGVGVVIGSRAYLGLGNRSEQMWELNLETFNWVRKNDFPGSTVSRNSGVYEHGGLIYILRSAEVQLSGVSEFWVFDPNAF